MKPWLVTKATSRSVKLFTVRILPQAGVGVIMSLVFVQVDSFNKHASGKSGSKLMARLPGSKLFGSKKSPRTPSPAAGNLVPSPSGNSITLDEMLVYQNVGLVLQLLICSAAHADGHG